MSEYGRLWQEVSDIREKLKLLVPKPGLANGFATLPDAIGTVAKHTFILNDLIRKWAEFEREMAKIKED